MKWECKRIVIASSQDAVRTLQRENELDSGRTIILHLNNRRELVRREYQEISVPAHDLLNHALMSKSSSLILAHGRIDCLDGPNGNEQQRALAVASKGMLLGIPVRDYIIIGYKTYYSFAEHGALPPVAWSEKERRMIWPSYALTAVT